MANYVELMLLKNDAGKSCVAVVPTGKAHSGDLALVDGELMQVERTAWADPASDIYRIIEDVTDVVTPDKILHEKYDKEELRVTR